MNYNQTALPTSPGFADGHHAHAIAAAILLHTEPSGSSQTLSSSFRLQRAGEGTAEKPTGLSDLEKENAGPDREQRNQIMPVSSGTIPTRTLCLQLPLCACCTAQGAGPRLQTSGLTSPPHPGSGGPGSLYNLRPPSLHSESVTPSANWG